VLNWSAATVSGVSPSFMDLKFNETHLEAKLIEVEGSKVMDWFVLEAISTV
jgi:hypothetical protein